MGLFGCWITWELCLCVSIKLFVWVCSGLFPHKKEKNYWYVTLWSDLRFFVSRIFCHADILSFGHYVLGYYDADILSLGQMSCSFYIHFYNYAIICVLLAISNGEVMYFATSRKENHLRAYQIHRVSVNSIRRHLRLWLWWCTMTCQTDGEKLHYDFTSWRKKKNN